MFNEKIKDDIYNQKENLFQQLITARKNNTDKEENFRTNYSILLNDLFRKLNINQDIHNENEYSVHKGRIDSLYGNFIIEYKAPGRISKNPGNDNAIFINQVKRHIIGLCQKDSIDINRIIGVVFDGYYVIYVKKQGNDWNISHPQRMTDDSHALFLMRLISVNLEGKPLTVKNLIDDFGPASKLSKKTIQHFYALAHNNKEQNKAGLLYGQWQVLYREVCGYRFDTNKIQINELIAVYSLENVDVDVECLVFAIQSYFALLIKFLSINVLTYVKSNSLRSTHTFNTGEPDLLKEDLLSIEDGGKYRQLGITNFLEGDFFGWYLYLWEEQTFLFLRDLVEAFNKYDYSLVLLEKDTAIDLLKNLYHELFPSVLRKNLGEFYTPDWLADFTIQTINPQFLPDKMFLDPTCGSGTFIIMLIKRFIEKYTDEIGSNELLQIIIHSVRGFDLNPLAVICARANYIIALGDLLSSIDSQIELPVYLCDSMLTILEGYEEKTKRFIIPTKAEVFVLPEILVNKQCINNILDIVSDCIRNKHGIKVFDTILCTKMPDLNQSLTNDELELLHSFYFAVKKLDDNKLDGIWTNIIKNSFAPVFQEKVDYIVGNPPWVVWQNLPEHYRESIQKHWYDYRIFDHKGQTAQLGSSHDDISVLLTYVIMDNYLKDKGELAFVINQNLLQASGGGDGFRKFSIKESIPVCVTSVNDFVNVEPFKHLGVGNKTATISLKKNAHTNYPLRYRKWHKHDSSIIDPNMSLDEVLAECIGYEDLYAKPINEFNSPWMITTEEKRRIFDKMMNVDVENTAYLARKGVDTSANGIFWLVQKEQISKKIVYVDNTPQNSRKPIRHITDFPIETDFLYPLLRGRDVKKWRHDSTNSILLAYRFDGKYVEKDDLAVSCPRTYEYFYKEQHGFSDTLKERANYKKFMLRQNANAPIYTVYNIGPYTFAPYKVVWKALSNGVSAVTISTNEAGKQIIPDHNLLMIPIGKEKEAYYLTGVLNAKIISEFVNAYISWFISAHILQRLKIPKYDENNATHTKIALLSKSAHDLANTGELSMIENEINEIVYKLLVQ